MTKTDQYRQLRKSGMTFQQIANQFGVSKQAVQNAINSQDYRWKWKKEEYKLTVKYPALCKYMVDNRITVTKLEEMTNTRLKNGLLTENLNDSQKKRICEVTGIPYWDLAPSSICEVIAWV